LIQVPGCIGNHQYWLRESATGHSKQKIAKPQKHKSPAFARLSFESWRETRDSNPGNAINVRRFSRPLCKIKRIGTLKAVGVPLLAATDQATGRILQGVRFWFGNCFCPSLPLCRSISNTLFHQVLRSFPYAESAMPKSDLPCLF